MATTKLFPHQSNFFLAELAIDSSPFDLSESCDSVDHDENKVFDTLGRSLESSPSASPRPLSSPPPMPRLLPYGATTPTQPIDMTLHPLEQLATGKMNNSLVILLLLYAKNRESLFKKFKNQGLKNAMSLKTTSYHLQLTVYHLQSTTVYHLQSTAYHLQLTAYHIQYPLFALRLHT